MAPIDRSHMTLYWFAIVSIALSCTILESVDVQNIIITNCLSPMSKNTAESSTLCAGRTNVTDDRQTDDGQATKFRSLYDIGESYPVPFRHPNYDTDRAQKLISLSMSRHLSTRNISILRVDRLLKNACMGTRFLVMLLTDRQTNTGKNIYLLLCRR